MPLHVVDINDTAVRIFRDGESLCESPGVALVERGNVVVGEEALQRVHLSPRSVNTRFWQQLNDSKMLGATRRCRHHADLAYHHLAHVLSLAGNPSEAVFAVPGTYNEQQLSLLLGIASASGVEVSGLVDAAVASAAATAPAGRYAVVDLHRHHAVLTEIAVESEVERISARTIDQPGLERIHDACVDLIADAFLEQSRFDPLHEAGTEQLLFNRLPTWLEEAGRVQELSIAIEYRGNRFSAKVPARELFRITGMVLGPIAEELPAGSQLLLTAALAALPGTMDHLAPAQVMPRSAVFDGIAEHRLALSKRDGGVSFATSLPAAASPTITARASPETGDAASDVATHMLSGAQARRITADPIYLLPDGTIVDRKVHERTCMVSVANGVVSMVAHSVDVHLNGQPVSGRFSVSAGDHITLDGGRALFTPIVVSD